jgi:hypothetical protein
MDPVAQFIQAERNHWDAIEARLLARIAELEANHEATVQALEGELERVKQNAAAWAEDVRRLRDALSTTQDNVAFVAGYFDRYYQDRAPWLDSCGPSVALLAAIRKRAGLEP